MADLRTLLSSSRSLQVAKLAILLLAGIAAAALAGKYVAGIPSSAAPPYLFLTVHLIIVVIWKLSDRKLPPPEEDKPTKPDPARKTEPSDESAALPPDSDESCVTDDESGEKSPASVVSARVEVEEEGENDTIDSTWSSIVLKKSDTWEGPRLREVEVEAADDGASAGGRKMEKSKTFCGSTSVSVSAAAEADDEWNQRFEAFIKKNYDQIRLQTDGSYRYSSNSASH